MSGLSRVTVAVLSWNGRHHLEICLAALERQLDPGVEWEVLVLDNGSSDGTAEWMRGRYGTGGTSDLARRFRLIESKVNLGFCAGNNRLVEEASGDAVALLNNDTRPVEGWLAALVDALRAAPDDVAAVSGKIVDWEGRLLDFGRGLMTFDGHAFQLDFRRPLTTARIPQAGEELPFACGGNLLIRRSSYLAVGGLDPAYFAYLEDVDLGWRLWSGGERVLFAPEAVVHHRSSATSDLLGSFHRGFLFERNAFLTAYKNYEAGLWEKVMPAIQLTLLARSQSLLLDNNPNANTFRIDPYAGWIADTAKRPAGDAGLAGAGSGPASGGASRGTELTTAPAQSAVAAAGSTPPARAIEHARLSRAHVVERLRTLGVRESIWRGMRRLLGLGPVANALSPIGPDVPAGTPLITDQRTIAQFRVLHYLLSHLDAAAASRAQVQARRKRSDREIFERFPVYLVPTYPGDEHLFASEGFAAWYPKELPTVRAALSEIMEMG